MDVTTLFSCMKTPTASNATNSPTSACRVSRSWAGSGSSRISPVSDWKTRISASGDRLGRGASAKRNKPMGRSRLEMLVLLVPQPAVDVATLEQLVMTTGVVEPPAFEHQDHVGFDQNREAVRN